MNGLVHREAILADQMLAFVLYIVLDVIEQSHFYSHALIMHTLHIHWICTLKRRLIVFWNSCFKHQHIF